MAAKKEAETAVVEDVLKLKALALDKARVRALWFDPEIGKRTRPRCSKRETEAWAGSAAIWL